MGSWTVTSTDPEEPRIWFFASGALIRRTPSSYATSVCSAACTSRLLAAFAGRTSTVVSDRSAAMKRTRPSGDGEDGGHGGGGVELLHDVFLRLVVSDEGKATLPFRKRQVPRCVEVLFMQVRVVFSLQ